MTVILITHDMEEAALAGRVILLADGQVRFDGTPEDFFGEDALLAEMGMEAPLSYRVRKLIDSDVFEKKIGDARVAETLWVHPYSTVFMNTMTMMPTGTK